MAMLVHNIASSVDFNHKIAQANEYPSPNIEFQLSPAVKIGQISALRGMESNMVPGQTYRLHYPSGISGKLMTLKSGELEGMKTTSVLGPGGIVAVAGLEPIDVTPEVALNVLNLWQFGILANQINQLAGQIGKIQHFMYNKSKAELENIFVSLRDISRRVPDCLEDTSYKTYLLTQLANVKKDVGEYFQLQLQAFDQHVTQKCDHINQRNNDYVIDDLKTLTSQPVFKALELVAVVELFEIVINGRFNSSMLNAAKDHFKDRSDQIQSHLVRYYQRIERELTYRQDESRQRQLTYYPHQSADNDWNAIFRDANEYNQQIAKALRLLDKILIPELGDNSVKSLCVSSMRGMLQISEST